MRGTGFFSLTREAVSDRKKPNPEHPYTRATLNSAVSAVRRQRKGFGARVALRAERKQINNFSQLKNLQQTSRAASAQTGCCALFFLLLGCCKKTKWHSSDDKRTAKKSRAKRSYRKIYLSLEHLIFGCSITFSFVT